MVNGSFMDVLYTQIRHLEERNKITGEWKVES